MCSICLLMSCHVSYFLDLYYFRIFSGEWDLLNSKKVGKLLKFVEIRGQTFGEGDKLLYLFENWRITEGLIF